MTDPLFETNAALRAEADELLLGAGLNEVLGRFGTVHVSGSYALRLMTWRDLDVYLETPSITVSAFFALGERIAALLGPLKMSFIDNRSLADPENPAGLYWGVRLGDVRKDAWKIDLWAMDPSVCRTALDQGRRIAARLREESRRTILALKSQLWQHPAYRNAITSQTICDAVLDGGVCDLEAFWEFVRGSENRPADLSPFT